MTVLCGKAFAADPDWFQSANKLYASGHFKDAASQYEKMIASGNATAAVYYNWGNALFRSGQKGKALLAYERALRILPRDENLRWNIGVLRSVLIDRLEPNENRLASQIRFVTDYFNINEACLALTVSLAVFFLAGLAGFFLPGVRSLTRLLRVTAVILGLIASALLFLKWMQIKDPRAVVLEKQVAARYGPSESEAKAFFLHEGAEARMLDRANGWLYLELPNKNAGWVPENACEIV